MDIKKFLAFAHRGDGFLGGVGHGVSADDGQPGIPQNLFAELDVVALEPDDQWQVQFGFFDRRYDTGGDDVALHDAAKNVDQNSLHMRVAQNDAKGRRDLFLGRAAADVEKIGGQAAEVLDD